MSIHVTDGAGTPTEVLKVYRGPALLSEVYSGADLVWANAQNYEVNSNITNLASWLINTMGADPNFAVTVTIPVGQIVRSSDPASAALILGNTEQFVQGVTLYILGEVQGAGGAAGQDGGDAIRGGSTSNNITIVNDGAIRAGGGGGGLGGNGANGNGWDSGDWSSYRYNQNETRFAIQHSGTGNKPEWEDINLNTNSNPNRPKNPLQDYYYSSLANGQHTYQRGTYRQTFNNGQGEADLYEIRRRPGYPETGTPGIGGQGGQGQGYNQAQGTGDPGTNGTTGAGNGGAGGNGGTWGMAGSNGVTGQDAVFYSDNAVNNSGFAGGAGGAAGLAIDSRGGNITLLGSGIVNGSIT